MQLRVLGPVELVRGGEVEHLAGKPRTLLAALAARRGGVVSPDQLADDLWGESPPGSAAKLLQVYVSQVRKALEPGLAIHTHPAGYALVAVPDAVDAERFERLALEGRAALAASNPALAASSLRRALDLWRGPAFADVRYEAWVRPEAERLEALRDAAVGDRFEAELRLGHHEDVLPELRALVAEDATRENVVAAAMLAAYRSNAAGEAAALYEAARRTIRDELGEEPGPELQDLRARIARRDPGLDAPPSSSTGVLPLPEPPNTLIGRERELREVRAMLERPGVRLVSLTGAGGSGKSRLALELAHTLAPEYANGAVLVELAALRDPALVLPTVARALALDPGVDAAETLAASLADRELLLVLDNVEHLRVVAPEIVRLLAAARRLIVVVTTRVVLHVSGEHVYPVQPLDGSAAVALFTERARSHDPSFALDGRTLPMVDEICRRLDGLPLPIELAASRVRALGLPTLRERLATRLAVLTSGPRDLPARQQTLRQTLDWSVALLEPVHATVLARLAVFSGSCPADAARDVAGADDDALVALVDHHLVQALDVDGERRFRLLETVREHAYERLGGDRPDAEAALVGWVVHLVGGMDLGLPALAALTRLEHEIDAVRDALRHAARDVDPTAELTIASSVWRFWWLRGYVAEARAVLDDVVTRRGLVPTEDGARVVRAAASMAWSMGDGERADALAADALAIGEQIGNVVERVAALNLLGVVATSRGRPDAAVAHLTAAIRIADDAGMPSQAFTSKLNLGIAYLETDQLDDARRLFVEVLEYRSAEGSVEGVGNARLNLGETEYLAGNHADAEAHFRAAATAFATIDFHTRHANALQGLAGVEAATGRAASAARHLGAAAAIIDTGWDADGTSLVAIAERAARDALGTEAFERLWEEGRRSAGVVIDGSGG